MTKRLAIAFFYDEEGIIDDYMLHLVKSLQPFVAKTIFVSNGPLSKKSEISINSIVEELIIRENTGFDVWGYKAAIESVGYDNLAEYDEIILYNHTFYGPIYPFSEMFTEMEKRSSDFWGISIHKEMKPNPFTGSGVLPKHINSHFIAVRQPMLSSRSFRHYWETMDEINSYSDSVVKHESRFSSYFSDLGYTFDAYQDPEQYGSLYPVFIDIDETMKNRVPILKRRLLFHDPLFHEANAINLPKALKIISKTSDYDMGMVWKNIARSAEPRILNTNAAMMSVLPDINLKQTKRKSELNKIAVCAHVYYVELLDELLDYTKNITQPYDFIATTNTIEKKREIEKIIGQRLGIANVIVRVVDDNRGRDMSAMFITCRDLLCGDKYDLVCRIHTKKTPQVSAPQGLHFKYHLLDNLLNSPGYVSNVIDLFDNNPRIGMALPPILHISFPTMGHAWFANKPRVQELLDRFNVKVPLDDDTPVAAYGSMFWFRPKALHKLFNHSWEWEDFPVEGEYQDGDLPHALERSLAYLAQDAGYVAHHIMSPDQVAYNYTMLEYKLQKMLANAPRHNFYPLMGKMIKWKKHGFPIEHGASSLGVLQSFKEFRIAIKKSLLHRSPKLFKGLRPIYRASRKLAKLGRR